MTEETDISSSDGERIGGRNLYSRDITKAAFVFFAQVILIYIVVIACVINLTIGTEQTNVWISLLSGSLGYLLPSPTIRRLKDGTFLPNVAEQ